MPVALGQPKVPGHPPGILSPISPGPLLHDFGPLFLDFLAFLFFDPLFGAKIDPPGTKNDPLEASKTHFGACTWCPFLRFTFRHFFRHCVKQFSHHFFTAWWVRFWPISCAHRLRFSFLAKRAHMRISTTLQWILLFLLSSRPHLRSEKQATTTRKKKQKK